MKQVKITVLKTSFEKDLAERYAMPGLGPCTAMKEGQVFVTDLKKPDGFCDTAWKCIFQYVFALANGGGADGFFYGDWIRESRTPRFPAATTACGPCTSRSSWQKNKGTPSDGCASPFNILIFPISFKLFRRADNVLTMCRPTERLTHIRLR